MPNRFFSLLVFVHSSLCSIILKLMPRSIKVRQACIPQVKASLLRQGFARQIDLAEQAQLSPSTVSKFLNGTPIYYLNFIEICRFLGLEWQTIADLNHRTNLLTSPSPDPVEIPPQEVEMILLLRNKLRTLIFWLSSEGE